MTARYLARPLKVDDVERFPDVPVGLAFEFHFGRVAPAAHLLVGAFVRTDRHRGMGYVGQALKYGLQAVLEARQVRVDTLDPRGHLPHFRNPIGSVFAVPFHACDFVGHGVPPLLERLARLQQFPPPGVQVEEPVDVDPLVLVRGRLSYRVWVLPDEPLV